MDTLNAAASQVLDTLTAGLDEPERARHIDNAPGAFMRVCVERLSVGVYAVAHYYTQAGNLVCDPEVTFLRTASGNWLPLTFEQGGVVYRVAVELDAAERPVLWDAAGLRDLVAFCNHWMRNIQAQQGELEAIRRAIADDFRRAAAAADGGVGSGDIPDPRDA